MSDALEQWQREREAQVAALGARPRWYQPFARRRWLAEWRRIHAVTINHHNLLLRRMYPGAAIVELAERKQAVLSMLGKAKESP